MSFPPSPPEPPIPSPPGSGTRVKIAFQVCAKLSRDGAAAVLKYARLLFERERQATPRLRSMGIQAFGQRISLLVKEAREGLYRGDRIFLASLHRFLVERGDAEGMTLREFKDKIAKAHNAGWLTLSTCRRFRGVNPMLITASAVRSGRRTFHLLHRFSRGGVHITLSSVLLALQNLAVGSVACYAERVYEDEQLRAGMPRLITLSPEDFAARAQAVADRCRRPMLISELYRKLEEQGETTGLPMEAFYARLKAASRAGRIVIDDGEHILCSNAPLPIPWGAPTPLLRRRASSAEA